MRGNSIKNRLMSFAFEKVPPHKPHLQASSSQIPGIRIWPIGKSASVNVFWFGSDNHQSTR